MNDFEMRKILKESHTIATVGLSSDPDKAGHYVPEYLIEHGYNVIPVNPTIESAMGKKAYPDLKSIPEKVDLVQIFRKAQDVPPIVDQAIEIGAKVIWMQLGIVNEEAAKKARDAGIAVVMDHCMMVEHKRLLGA
jgi:predicted CoA-binding protein